MSLLPTIASSAGYPYAGRLLRVFVGGRDKRHGRPLYEASVKPLAAAFVRRRGSAS